MKKKYNILWLDDDFDRTSQSYQWLENSRKLIKDHAKGDLNLTTAIYAEEFLGMLSNDYDAVILDVRGKINYSDNKEIEAEAFFKAAMGLKQHGYRGVKLILSGQPYITKGDNNLFMQTLSSFDFSIDDIYDKIVLKDPVKFGNLLIKKIEEANSIEFQIRNKYPKAYEAAKKLGKGDFFCHLFEEIHDPATIVSNIQEMRDVIEKMKDSLCEKKIIPPLSSLNSIYIFFKGMEVETYIIKDSEKNKWFHPILVRELELLICITQDSKHSKDELDLHVREYLEKSHDENVLRAMTYILVSLLNAYHDIIYKINDLPITGMTWEKTIVRSHLEVKSDPLHQDHYYVEFKHKNKTVKCLLGLYRNNKHCDCYGNEIVPGDEINLNREPGNDKNKIYDAYIDAKNINKCQ